MRVMYVVMRNTHFVTSMRITYVSIGILILALVGLLFLFGFRIRKCNHESDEYNEEREKEKFQNIREMKV